MTIAKLRAQHASTVPHSPRKVPTKLKCAVLTKSHLKPTVNKSNMFTMTLCDEDTSSTIKAACFKEDLYSKFDVATTYILHRFKVKKLSGHMMEIHIDTSTNVSKSQIQYNIEKSAFTISQILRHEAESIRLFQVKAKVSLLLLL